MVNKFQMALVFALLGLVQAQTTWTINIEGTTTPVTCEKYTCGKDKDFTSTLECAKLESVGNHLVRSCDNNGDFCPY